MVRGRIGPRQDRVARRDFLPPRRLARQEREIGELVR